MTRENAAQFLPLVQALAEGKTIQYRIHDEGAWRDVVAVDFVCPPTHYRIKPVEFALPPWANGDVSVLHNPDGLTAEQVGEGYRLLCKSELGSSIHPDTRWWSQIYGPGGGVGWSDRSPFGPLRPTETYRLPLSVPWPDSPKAARRVPLQGKDVVAGCEFAEVERPGDEQPSSVRYFPTCVASEGIHFHNQYGSHFWMDFKYIHESGRWFWRKPGQSTWEPCSKISSEQP